ncbi:uncharacterized protein LOC121382990 [Gigantopelta aegis]|uniref:uncharacterized protein LOC121382990 n=1 Tax=Gigantopelta aegis TaxID=1735272 RepID=UPI001B888582|nr:uncharacterized protein LOC121382990 [Gigantopelta aegis]XP_041368644.1 uncharacterized protein LOC121382990 [Gigantopelta aegis]
MDYVFIQQLRVLLPLACVIPVGRCANLTYTEVTSSVLGHSRSSDGTLTWGGLPQATYNGVNRNAPSSPWELTVAFTRVIINSVQTQNFPYDTVRGMMKGHFNMKDIEKYVVNIAIACFTAALLVMFIVICIVVYVRHEFRKRDKQKYFVKRPTMNARASAWLTAGVVVGSVINLIFIILVTIVSIHTYNGFKELNERVGGAMTDVTKYFNNTKNQYEFVTSVTNDWLSRDVLGTDLDKIGYLVWEPGRDSFLPTVAPVYSSLADLDARTQKVLTLLKSVDTKVSDIKAGLGTLMKTNITDLHFALTATYNDWSCIGCDGTCAGCQPIVVNDIFYQTDFDKLPDITGNIAQMNTIVAAPTSGSMQSPEYYYYNGIPDILKSRYTSVIVDLNNTINNYKRIVKESISPLFFPTESDMYFDTLRGKMDDFHKMLVTGDKTRFGFTWIFIMFNSAGILFIIISLLIIIAEKRKARKEIEPEYHLARVFLAGVVIGYIVLVLGFISVAMVSFYGGANLEKAACQPGKDMSFVEQVIDFPGAVSGYPGYFLSSLILNNGNYDLKVADTYRACQLNDYAYRVFKQNITAPNLYSDLNYTAPFVNTSAMFDQLYTSLPSVILVPSEFETWITQFQTATTLNRTSFDLILNRTVVRADLTPYTDNLVFIANTSTVDGGPLEPAKSRLFSIAADLKSIQPSIDQLTILKNDVWADFSALKAEVDYINNVTTLAVPQLRSVEALLQGKFRDIYYRRCESLSSGISGFPKTVHTTESQLDTRYRTVQAVNRSV